MKISCCHSSEMFPAAENDELKKKTQCAACLLNVASVEFRLHNCSFCPMQCVSAERLKKSSVSNFFFIKSPYIEKCTCFLRAACSLSLVVFYFYLLKTN